ncbi:MAG: polyphosphate kinase 2 [Bacteroidia bacterium]|nr:polyphosphate kinase 2 [Bacteroidia bacterium]NNF32418.1 polyphosphate kinase 2 [Flavobacteriaceae bacterium]NNK55458.1 polyphosphate kinase 2 [Flavobacteriaceae bacterium]
MHLHALENDPEYIELQTEMVRMQNWLIETNNRLIIICEGRDSAGKGGAIMRFIRYINPRHYRVIALNKPTQPERGQWYFQRYIQHFPSPGEIVFFDRSWYNRAVVEPVMGFCTKEQYDNFIKQVVQFENMIVEDGILLFKLWFSIDKDEQKIRLEERKVNPLINWKLSTVDMQAQMKWDEFTKYKELMFQKTASKTSPWIIINGNNKDLARKEAMRFVLRNINYSQKALTKAKLDYDPEIVQIKS